MTATKFKQDLDITGNITLSGDITIGGNTVGGNANTDTVTLNADITSNIVPDADITYDLGTDVKTWREVFTSKINSKTGDDLDIHAGLDIALYPQGNIWISQGTKLIFEGTTPDDWEVKLQATSITADRDIILPDASGTVAVSVSDTTTTTQGALSLDFTLSAAGNISATGTAYGLGSGSSPAFTSPAITTSITTPSTTFDLVNTTATTVNFAGAATAINIGADGTAVTTVKGKLTTAGSYGNIHLTTYASVFVDGTSTNNIVQTSSNSRTNGMGMWSTGGNPRIYSTSDIEFRSGVTLRDQDTPTGGSTVATIGSTGIVTLTNNIVGTATQNVFNTTSTTINAFGAATTALNIGASNAPITGFAAPATTSSTASSLGYLGIPQSATATTATLAIGDAGKHIYVTTAGQTITIPDNATVSYPIGTTIEFIAGPSATTVTIAITSDTMYLAGTGTTGSRTLAAYGMATAIKVAATTWFISGNGLT